MVSRGGVNATLGSALQVVQNPTPGMSVQVGTGMAAVPGTEGTSQGVYLCMNPTATIVNVTASHGSLNRIDLITCRVYDTQYSGALNQWTLEVVTGTAAASPSAPALPNNTMLLAQLLITAGSTQVLNANITDRRIYMAQGYIPCTSTTRPAVPVAGMAILETDTKSFLFYDGSSWGYPNDSRVIARVASASSSAAIGTTETVIMTLPSTTYKANRAYLCWTGGALANTNSAAQSAWTVKKTSTAGASVFGYPRIGATGTNNDVHVNLQQIFTVGGSDVTATLVLCMAATSNTMTHTAAASNTRHVTITDIGPASAYGTAPVLS
jgi:hypothetical protein